MDSRLLNRFGCPFDVMAGVEAWSAQLRPSLVFDQFSDSFVRHCAQWLPELDLTAEKLETNYGPIRNFAPSLERANGDGEPFLRSDAASRLRDLISRLNNDIRDVLMLAVTDVCVFSSLIPVYLLSAPSTSPLLAPTHRIRHSLTILF